MAPLRLKIAANLSMMFSEAGNLLDRYSVARNAGFKAVECAFPYDYPVDDVVRVKESAGVEQVLINAYPGSLDQGDLGLAAIPGREKEFEQSLETSINYAKRLNCPRIHIMAGRTNPDVSEAAMGETFVKNLKAVAPMLEKEGIVGLIEPINGYSIPGYFLNSFERAMQVLRDVNSPALKLQLDLFHLQFIAGNLTHNITELLPHVGHIQVAQVPDRGEPHTSGELNYRYVFNLLDRLGYDGWIGCEYKPAGASTVDGLSWVKEFNLAL